MAERPRIKICGLTRAEDARAAERAGVDYTGVILTAGFGRSITPDEAARVLEGVESTRVAVVVDETATEAAHMAQGIDAGVLQLHGSEDLATINGLRDLGEWRIWKAVRARTLDDVRRAVDALSDVVDGFLIEGWREGVVGGGGVPVRVDAQAVRAAIPPERSFILAGGLDPENVTAAVARFAPDVVDVSSGVEQMPGVKDARLVQAFAQAAIGAIVGSPQLPVAPD